MLKSSEDLKPISIHSSVVYNPEVNTSIRRKPLSPIRRMHSQHNNYDSSFFLTPKQAERRSQKPQLSCEKHDILYDLLGKDPECQLNCLICCECLRGLQHGHKRDNINHQSISIEQLYHHFSLIKQQNIKHIQKCLQALDIYMQEYLSKLQQQIMKQKQRLQKYIEKIMLTEITRVDEQLNILQKLYAQEYQTLKCKDIGRIAKKLFQYGIPPKKVTISPGYEIFMDYLNGKSKDMNKDFEKIVQSKEHQSIVLKEVSKDNKYPHFERPLPKPVKVKTEESLPKPKKTVRKSVPKSPPPQKSLLDIKDFRIQIKKPVEFTGSQLVQGKQDTQFLQKLFTNKKLVQVKMLYRASQNNFSVTRFHQYCDNIPDTMVIARTEFGKIIGGYTPLKWKSTQNTVHNDLKKQSFLFSLTLKQKMILADSDNAIFNSSNYGPTFGSGADLAICHNANVQRTSYSQFPYSYSNPRYQSNQQHSTFLFTGQSNGNHFCITQWEVWKMIFKE